MKTIFILIAFASTAFALTPKERQLVEGLNQINAELRADNEAKDKAVAEADTKAMFLQQKNDALSANLANAKTMEAQQTADLSLAQGKIHALEQDRDKQALRADTAELQAKKKTLEAHKNAQERDIFVWAFALLAATAACYALFPVLNKVLNVTFPWTLAWIGAWVFLAGTFYGCERIALRYLINHL